MPATTTPPVAAETTTHATNDIQVVAKLVCRDGRQPFVALAVAADDGDCLIAEPARLLGAELALLADVIRP